MPHRPHGLEALGNPDERIRNKRSHLVNSHLDTLLVPLLPIVSCMRSLISAPAGVHGGHVDPVQLQLEPTRPRQHVQGGLGHVRVRVLATLAHSPKLTFHGGDVDDELPRTW